MTKTEYDRRRYEDNPEPARARSRSRYAGMTEKQKKVYNKERYQRSRDQQLSSQRRRRVEAKADAFIALGGVCNYCGESDPETLEIDHVMGGGQKDRDAGKTGITWHKHVKEHVLSGEYQLLCGSCHRRKTNGVTDTFSIWDLL